MDRDRKIPVIAVAWDEKKQIVGIQFDKAEFRTWDFVIAVLDMAKAQADQHRRMAQIAAMQQQAVEQQAVSSLLRPR